jgi:hypothetical protein
MYSLQSGVESILCNLVGKDVVGAARFFGIFFRSCGSSTSPSSERDVIGLLSADRLLPTFGSMRWAGGDGYGPGVEPRRGENVSKAAGNGEDMDMDKCLLERETEGNRVGSLDMVCEYKLSPCCLRRSIIPGR